MPVALDATLARNWWAVLLRGIVGILFGLVTFFFPGISLLVLVLLFGAYAFADGVFAIVSAIARHETLVHWWVVLVEGIIGVLAGIVAFIWPGITAIALLFVIAAWAILTGLLELAAAFRLRHTIRGEWLLVLAGVLSIVFGIFLLAYPGAGALAVVLWIGIYALVFGVLLVILAVRLRSWHAGAGMADVRPRA